MKNLKSIQPSTIVTSAAYQSGVVMLATNAHRFDLIDPHGKRDTFRAECPEVNCCLSLSIDDAGDSLGNHGGRRGQGSPRRLSSSRPQCRNTWRNDAASLLPGVAWGMLVLSRSMRG